MKSFKDTVGAKEDNIKVVIGSFDFYEVESTEEAVTLFGEAAVVALINRSYIQGQQNLAREACKKEGEGKKSVEEIQAAITGYKPGASVTRFSIKNFNDLLTAAAMDGKAELVAAAAAIYRDGRPEEAFNFLLEAQNN